jgi:hypothetical protein
MNGIVCAESVRVGGVHLDEAIISYIRKKYNLVIGEPTAEEIKIKIGAAVELDEKLEMHVQGRDQIAGLPKTITINSSEVVEAISEPLAAIVNVVRAVLSKTPPDTFRAAAIEQLEIWGERAGCPVIKRPPGADAAGLAFDALRQAQAESADVLLIDTAGRLHNKAALMEELAKVVRVLKKLDPAAPHDVLLVLDATTGQNARAQVETFSAMVPITGLVVTKLDGTARGGVVVALARQFGLPVVALGVGEGIDDLRPFQARAFAEALLDLEAA